MTGADNGVLWCAAIIAILIVVMVVGCIAERQMQRDERE